MGRRRKLGSASMGPRPFGRGRPSESQAEYYRLAGFNGAATFRSRKASATRVCRYGSAGLQWGRDLSVAEGRDCEEHIAPVMPLQWGRDLSVAEGRSSRAPGRCHVDASMGPRPFGRGRTSGCARSTRSRGCFNGAATFRSRKAPGRRTMHGRIITLQWGRDLSVAEGVWQSATMTAPTPLQWGRDLSVAEGEAVGLTASTTP